MVTVAGGETTISLVGDEDFDGIIRSVSVREQEFIGESIDFRSLTSFQAPQGHSSFARVGFVRAIGVLAGEAQINVRAIYDYAIEQTVPSPGAAPNPGTNLWDSGVWDQDLWDYALEGQSFTVGTLGIGRAFAVAMNGSASTRINIVGWDTMFNVGGYL